MERGEQEEVSHGDIIGNSHLPSSKPPPQNSPHTKILSLGALRSMSLSGDGIFKKGVNA